MILKEKVVQVVLFSMNDSNIIYKVDGFRFINSLHTTARQLPICSEIIKQLSNKQLPKDILFQLMVKWSIQEESINDKYKNSKGKLTQNGKATTAFKNYLDLCESLKLVIRLNDFYASSRLSFVLKYFMEHNDDNFSKAEKIFYLLQLFLVDSDGILYVLDEINTSSLNQKALQVNFKDNFNLRLVTKQILATPIVKNSINERYRTINYVWQNPEKYAEHLLIPRCEWLTTLGILDIKKNGSSTIYSFTSNGRVFFEKLPVLSNSKLKDINEIWIFQNFFSIINFLYPGNNTISFKDMDPKQKINELGFSLDNALKVVKTSNSFKIPLFDCLVFICIDLFSSKNIIIEMSDVLDMLKAGITYGLKSFNLKHEGRLNESYIISEII
ncbi:hypothetical protein ACM40_15770 [Chryseobacterium sp. BLS98]|nr:hypothetical protein ACM40_15770 [Chryseobacterium sp. BLS98]